MLLYANCLVPQGCNETVVRERTAVGTPATSGQATEDAPLQAGLGRSWLPAPTSTDLDKQ
ncbi:hypothetical protein CDEST_12083 [Colletotrichum destructivum]|uniref:Uncharacterized protein n=1 Tax=Colletotrichum destructivum TaxID=34406 RepID=A0AAX4IUV7_9PEZI|nr:hypothetical protein CDEST_12083 [Colletotrichum destructivum]